MNLFISKLRGVTLPLFKGEIKRGSLQARIKNTIKSIIYITLILLIILYLFDFIVFF